MPQLYYDLLLGSLFAIILLILIRFRKTAFSRDGAAYHRMILGLSILLGFSLIQIAGHQGLFSGMTYLGDTSGRKVVEAIGIFCGLVFLLSGVGAWLPSLTKGRDNRRKLNKRYYCLKMINSALDKGKDLDETSALIMNYLSSYLGFERCTVYKYSSRREMLYLSGAVGFERNSTHVQDRITLTDMKLKKTLNQFPSAMALDIMPEGEGMQSPDLVIPIAYQNRLYGIYFCWIGAGVQIDDDLLDFASAFSAMVGRYTHNHVINVKNDYHRIQQDAYERLSIVCNQISAVPDLVPRLFQIIQELVGAEFLSLASLDNSGENMIRYTIGSSGRLLLERGVSRQTQGTDIFNVFEKGQPVIDPEIRSNDVSGEQDGLFLSCGMHSKMICPVEGGSKIVAILTLGHTRPHHFTRYHLHRIRSMTNIIAGVIQREQLNRSLEVKEDQMLRLQLMQRQILDNSPVQSFFNDACNLLTSRMKCTVARISLLDKDQSHLVSQACRSIRETGNDLQEGESIPLSLLPWHRMTLDAKKIMLINQADPESQMPPYESASALIPNIKSAILVPIILNEKVRGIISIGEARNWNRRAFGSSDLVFAKDLAAKCSVALRMKQLEVNAEQDRERLGRMVFSDTECFPELMTRVKSPLTSIIGAVDLLRLKGATDEFSTKYYDLILKSADRIKSMTEINHPRIEEAEEVEPEQVIG